MIQQDFLALYRAGVANSVYMGAVGAVPACDQPVQYGCRRKTLRPRSQGNAIVSLHSEKWNVEGLCSDGNTSIRTVPLEKTKRLNNEKLNDTQSLVPFPPEQSNGKHVNGTIAFPSLCSRVQIAPYCQFCDVDGDLELYTCAVMSITSRQGGISRLFPYTCRKLSRQDGNILSCRDGVKISPGDKALMCMQS